MKECIICKKEFKPNSNIQKCCSKYCFKIHRKEYNRSDMRKDYNKKYKQSEKYQQYAKSDEHKKYMNNYSKEYQHTEKRINYLKAYEQSEKRKRYKKSNRYNLLNNLWNRNFGKYNALKKRLRRKERLNNCIHSFSKAEWKLKCEATNGICPCCYKPFDNDLHKLSLDHIFALYWANIYFKQTGIKFVYTIDKVQPMCLSCNCSKQDKIQTQLKWEELIPLQ